MSIFRLSSSQIGIDCATIHGLDFTIRSNGGKSFDFLLQVSSPYGTSHFSLHSLNGAGAVVNVKDIVTEFAPFNLQVVTNIKNSDTVDLLAEMKNSAGAVTEKFTQQHFSAQD